MISLMAAQRYAASASRLHVSARALGMMYDKVVKYSGYVVVYTLLFVMVPRTSYPNSDIVTYCLSICTAHVCHIYSVTK